MKKIVLFLAIFFTFCSRSFGYTDINSEYWGYKAINELSSKGILSGYPEGDFRPEEKMSKAEFMTVLSKIIGLKPNKNMNVSHWADEYINSLKERNIVDFSEYSNFNPDSDITRWEICKMIVNSFESTKEANVDVKMPVFLDIDSFNIEEQRVAKILKDTGVLAGYPDGTVGFSNTSTRAEVSCFMYNLVNRLDDIKDYGKIIVYEDDRAVSNLSDDKIRLRKYQFAEDIEYCTTIISNIKIFEFEKAGEYGYNSVFEDIYSEKNEYLAYRNKFGKGNYVLAVEFKTRNNTSDYDIYAGYPFLHISFDEEDEITIIDSFDIDEIYYQSNKNSYNGKVVKPGESGDTSAFYVLDKLPDEKFYINRSITTLYDSKNGDTIKANSFHSAVIYL